MSDDEERLLLGGTRGVGQLYDRHAKAVFRLAFALLRGPEDAQDAVQDTFLLAWRKRHTVTLMDGSTLPWFLTTARLTSLAARRNRTRRASQATDSKRAESLSQSRFEDADAVRAALRDLKEADVQVLTLVLIEQRSYADAAAELGVSVAAVGKRVQRARLKFVPSLPIRALFRKELTYDN